MNNNNNNNKRPINIGLFWDQLWRQVHSSKEPALWDVPPSLAVVQDYQIFQDVFSPELPILDIGCGSGIQTGYLGSIYSKVYGVDASKKAIAAAQKLNAQSKMTFELLNLLDRESVRAFYEKSGDTNIYLRGVLHQIPKEHRSSFVNQLKVLMGNTGSIYLIETAPNIQVYIQALAENFSELPILLKSVLTSHFPPIGVSLEEINGWFGSDKFKILNAGNSNLKTNLILENGKHIELPAVYALIKTT